MVNQITHLTQSEESANDIVLRIQEKVQNVYQNLRLKSGIEKVQVYVTELLDDGEKFFATCQENPPSWHPQVFEQIKSSPNIYRRDWGNVANWSPRDKRRIQDLRNYFIWLAKKITEIHFEREKHRDIPNLSFIREYSEVFQGRNGSRKLHPKSFRVVRNNGSDGGTAWSSTQLARNSYDCDNCPEEIHP